MANGTDKEFLIRVRADIDNARRQLGQITGELDKVDRSGRKASRGPVGRFLTGLGNKAKSAHINVANLQGAIAALGVAGTIRALVRARFAMDSIESSLRVATGSATAAAKEFGFVRQEAERLGLDLRSTAKDYAQLSAASRGTAVEGEATREIFLGVVEAMTALGRGSEATSGALTAIEQIISKGRVSAEELRQQLGERLPGAFQLAARSIGVTTAELDEMLVAGQLTADELLPKMAKELRETFGEQAARRAGSLRSELNRLKTVIFELSAGQDLGGLNESVRELTDTLKDPNVQEGITTLLGGMIKLVELAARGASKFAEFAKALGETFAAGFGTDTLERIIDVNRQIRVLEQQIQMMGPASEGTLQPLRDELSAARAELVRLEKQYAAANFEPIIATGGGGETTEEQTQALEKHIAVREKSGEEIDKYIAKLERERVTMRLSREEVVDYELRLLGAGEAVRETAQEHVKAIESFDAYNRKVEEAKEIIEGLRTPTEEYLAQLERYRELFEGGFLTQEQFAAAVKQQAKSFEEAQQKLSELGDEGDELATKMEAAARGWGEEFSTQLARMVTQGKADFKQLADTAIQELLRILIYQKLVQPALEGLGLVEGDSGSGTTSAGTAHTGGVAGNLSSRRSVPSALFVGAPRYHTGGIAGMRNDEVPAILRRGERVLSPAQTRAYNAGGGGPSAIEVSITNNGTPQQATRQQGRLEGDRFVVSVTTDDIVNGGTTDRVLRQTYGLKRKTA